MFGFLKKILGSKSDKDIKKLYPIVDKINNEFELLKSLSDDELRGKTDYFKDKINKNLQDSNKTISELRESYVKNKGNLEEKEIILSDIDKIKENQKLIIEETLENILPEAFAVVKETARRFSENKELKVKATDYDKELSNKKDNIEIIGSNAIWYNEWDAAGIPIEWNMIHYDVQLIGGIVLHQGKISEMATGEGKTLVATLPAYLNALSGRGVHIVTVNDYLAKRDSEWMGKVFNYLGVSTGCITNNLEDHERKKNYACDITYATNNELGFDYLRDNMKYELGDMVQRGHNY